MAPETLLTMHPLDALRAQIAELLKAPLKSTYLKIEKPVSLGGLRTSVQVSIDKSKAPLALWDRVDSHTFEYSRLDLGTFTSGLNKTVKTTLPLSPEAILRNVFYPYSIPIANNDLVPALYTDYGSADVIAADESWRWVGETTIILTTLGIAITDVLVIDHFTLSFTAEFNSADIKNRLTSYINFANASSMPVPLNTQMFALGSPVVNGPDSAGDNTAIKLTFNGTPYIGEFTVYYARRSFPKTFSSPVRLKGYQLSNTSQLAAAISDELGCNIETSDIKPEQFPTIANGAKAKLAVNFADSSLAFVGSVLVEYTKSS